MADIHQRLSKLIRVCTKLLNKRVAIDDCPKYIFGMIFLKILHDDSESIARQYGWDLSDTLPWQTLTASPDVYAFHRYLEPLASTAPANLQDLVASINPNEFDQALGSDLNTFARLVGEFDFREVSRNSILDTLTSSIEDTSTKAFSTYYTSETVSNLLAKLTPPGKALEIYDPACGTGRLLLNTYREAKALNPEAKIHLFGQEIVSQTAMIARIFMFIAGVEHWDIRVGDSLTAPQFLSAGGLLRRFDTVVSVLPFGVRIGPERESMMQNDPRFYGGVAPTGDVLFLEHVVASMSSAGRAILVVAPGALFRSGIEGYKRRGLVEADLVDAVIELPNGVLTDTRIAPIVVIFSKNKPEVFRNSILFVDAKNYYTKHHQHNTIDLEHQEWILNMLSDRDDKEGVSRLVDHNEIATKNYVLVPSTYLHTSDFPVANGFLVKSAPVIQLQNIAEIYQGIRNDNVALKGEGDTPVIQGRDLSSRNLTVENLGRVRLSGTLKRGCFVKSGDLLIQRIGEKPAAHLVEESLEGLIFWDTIYLVRLYPEHQYLRQFLFEYLNSPVWYEYLTRTRLGSSGAPTLRLSELRQAIVPVPPEEIVSHLVGLYAVERDLCKRLETLRELKTHLFDIENEIALQEQLQRIMPATIDRNINR